jgi:putative transposase
VSVAGLACYRPGRRSRLIFRAMPHGRRLGDPKGFRERELALLLDAAHQQLAAPIVLVWDQLNTHQSIRMRAKIAARPWLRVYRLPAYAPELKSGREGVVGTETQPRQPAGPHPA